MRAYIDADILIWHLRGDQRAADFLCQIRDAGELELWIGALQRAEVVFFMRPGEEEATRCFLAQFNTSPIDADIVDRGGELYRKWHPSHGIDVNDALLAATVMKTGGKIFCLNTRHYPSPNVVADRPWT
ncbi:MAG: PIN domain-containing protein [Deferrisomatales bacterium]|nr:PIN domain-containing protein [Deferrisomatales bacterium]